MGKMIVEISMGRHEKQLPTFPEFDIAGNSFGSECIDSSTTPIHTIPAHPNPLNINQNPKPKSKSYTQVATT